MIDDDAFIFPKGSKVVLLHYHLVISFASSSDRAGRGLDSKAKPGRGSASRRRDAAPLHLGRWACADRLPPAPQALALSRTILPVLDIFSSPGVSSRRLLWVRNPFPQAQRSEARSATRDSDSRRFARAHVTPSDGNEVLSARCLFAGHSP